MTQIAQLEVEGDGAVSRAAKFLKALETDGGQKRVEITIVDQNESGPDTQKSDHESPTISDFERSEGRIRYGTSHHYTLQAIKQLSQHEQSVTGNKVVEAVSEYEPNSVRPALTQLYERMLVNREKVGGASPHYVYEITDWGEEVLNELGKPE